MRMTGARRIHRLLALVLALALGLGMVPARAATLPGWEGAEVSVLWTDPSGTVWQYPAVRVPQEQMTYTWWVTLPPEALGSQVQLQVLHPDPAYTYWAPDWTLNLHWNADKDALAVDDMYTYYIGYSHNGVPQVSQMQDCMKLLLSTQQPPFDYTEDVLPGGATLLPAGDEGFASTPGAELITPGGSAAPEPEAAEAYITVYYKHADGRTLDVRDVMLTGEGTHTLWPESDKVGGLNLSGEYSQTVTVYAGGYTDVPSVTFWYEDAYVQPVEPAGPVTATIDVYYYHQDGQELDHRIVTLEGEGTHYIYPESSVAASFELISDEAYNVYVDANGWVDLASVSFIYRDPYTAPVTGEVTVMYVLENGTRIDSRTVTVAQGDQTLWPESNKVGGLTLVSEASVNVYVDGGGAVSPNPVTFVYREPVQQVSQVKVTAYVFNEMGEEIALRQEYTLSVGTHRIEAPAGNAVPGYELISEAVIEVTVNADGSYSPAGQALSFWYYPVQEEEFVTQVTQAPAAQMARVTMRYLDSRGYSIAGDQVAELGNGTHTLTPDYSHVPSGYAAIAGTDAQQVKVTNGRANVSSVSFYFQKEQTTPAAHAVTVYYYDTLGNEIAPRQTLQLTPGTHWLQANPENLPADYNLASDAGFNLTVYSDGSLDRDAQDVGFWYAKQQVQVRNATITVRYVDGSGRAIAGPFTQELTGGKTHQVWPDAGRLPEAYDVSAAEPVNVNVTEEGYASPAVVSFVAELRRDPVGVPVGEEILRYGIVNDKDVALRTEPYTTKSNTVIKRVQKGGVVYMLSMEYNTSGEAWTKVIVDGREGYMKSEFIDMLTPAASQAYAASVGATPVPTVTPAPSPTESFVQFITPVPVSPTPATGYAVLMWPTDLRTGTGSNEMTLTVLQTEELVIVSESFASGAGESWSYVRTLDNLAGFVPASALRLVSQQEADWRIAYWEQLNATPIPTQLATNTPMPEQLQGYALTTANNVPLRRMSSEQSRIVDYLPYNTVVFITGQTYADGVTWQNVAVDGESGYIRSDLVRFMTEREETAYLNTFNTALPAITPTTNPYDSNGLSSYGYVTTDNVNFRQGASTATGKLRALNQYAMALVLDTERVNGVTWYRVNYGGQTGYIHGSYFHQMTLKEFSEFYGGDKYRQGLANNDDARDDSASGVGGQVTQEDQTVDDWYASGNVIQPSFAPFLPVGTVEPIAPTATPAPTLEPLPGYVTQGGSATATPPGTATGSGQVEDSASELPMPGASGSVTYPMQESESDSNALIWVIVIGLLVLAVGGAVVFMQHQRKQQQIAMKAAQRRAQQARSAARPYAAQGGQPTARTGAYPAYGQQLPVFPQQPQAPESQAAQRPYARTAQDAAQPKSTGRRTAWQQAHAEKKSEDQV